MVAKLRGDGMPDQVPVGPVARGLAAALAALLIGSPAVALAKEIERE